MRDFFRLQYKRSFRHIKEKGIHPFLGIFLLLTGFIGLSELIFQRVSYPEYIYPLLLLPFILKLGSSSRNEFLTNCFSKQDHRKIRLVENILISIPFIVFLLAKQFYLFAIIPPIISIASAPFTWGRQFNPVIPTPFFKYPFEFTIGFRNRFFLYLIGYLVTYFSIQANNFNLGIVVLLSTYLVSLSFYSLLEPIEYVWVHHFDSRKFLLHKLRIAVLYSLLPGLPIVITLSVVYPTLIHLTLLFYAIGMLYMIAMVLAKYAHYPSEINLVYGAFLGFGLFFPPLLLVIIPFFYHKAKLNLEPILK